MEPMGRVFVVEDEFHAEVMGQFRSEAAAMAFLADLRGSPLAPLNRPPCTTWETCSRKYYLLEFDDSTAPWVKLSSKPAFEVSHGVVRPLKS
jgi:hypothetical protein